MEQMKETLDAVVHYVVHHVPLWAVLTVTAVALLYWYITKDFKMFEKYGITGPKAYPIFGTAWPMLSKGIFLNDLELFTKYKKNRVIRTFEFGNPGVMILDPTLMKAIFVKEFSHFVNRKDLQTTAPPFDRSLLSIRDDHWRHVRNSVSPTFSGAKLKMMMPLIQKCSDSLIDVLEKKAETRESVDGGTLFSHFTMDVIGSTMFGLDVNSLHDPDHPFVKHSMNLIGRQGILVKIIIFLFVVAPWLVKLMNKMGLNIQRSELKYIEESMLNALEERRKDKGKYHDFLALMVDKEVEEETATNETSDGIKWSDKGLTKKDILSQMTIFFFAGFDTTANTLVFMTYNMCLHQDLQKRLQDEVDQLLDGQAPNYENVQKLVYLDMFMNETLRLYGPGTRSIREADIEIEVDGVTIPKGVSVWLPFSAFHRDPDTFPEPDKFDPERFSAEAKAARDPSLFSPFGQGPRNCVGMRLAIMEVKMGIAKILQKCSVTLDPETPTEIKMAKFQPKPEKPFKFLVTMRS